MSIFLTTSESRPALNEVRLISFTANVELKYAQAIYEVGYADADGWHGARKFAVEWGENATRSFASLVQQVSPARDFKNALEQWAVQQGVFVGTVA